jgi:DNA invertase Pin-like site-specific DNA recombinase
MSTDAQLRGHGKQRQLERSAAYAQSHGLDLADERQLEDIGVSAFKGANVKEGALGQFLQAVQRKLIPVGSYLLVESLDRISRQEILKSVSLFLQLVQAGINVVTLQDEHVYRAEQTDLIDLLYSLTILSRAHEESQIKSQRVGAAWANKRAKANLKPLTKLCPHWLIWSTECGLHVERPERVAVVKSIFADTIGGMGSYAITKRLNKQGIPTFGKSKGWQRSYVSKIIRSRAVIGEYQPCKLSPEGKREPVGDPIQNYFPKIIPE